MSVDTPEVSTLAEVQATALPGKPARGPWAEAGAKLARNRVAMSALGCLILILVVCLMAPLYAADVAHNDPFQSNLDGSITIDGTDVDIMQPSSEGLGLGVEPIGPTWHLSGYFLGSDNLGRDVFARVLYGGRNSLLIAGSATLICLIFGALTGLVAGFFGGVIDLVLSRLLDILWAFPVFLLAISLSVVLIHDVHIGPFTISSGGIVLPILIIGVIYIPYVARPIRGQVITLSHSEFVTASIGLGVPSGRILWRDILPNVATTLIVFAPLMLALNMLTECALSFVGLGVQPPNASWGSIINDGQGLLYTRPWVAIAPGIAIVITVLSLNLLGDGVRDALDPRSKLRIG
jgi:peptide/nickel transport system permease protein